MLRTSGLRQGGLGRKNRAGVVQFGSGDGVNWCCLINNRIDLTLLAPLSRICVPS
jgi:hypothetical protein